MNKASNEQSSARKQHHSQRDLPSDERLPKTRAADCGNRPFGHGSAEVHFARSKRGEQPEEQTGQHGKRQREAEHAAVERDAGHGKKIVWQHQQETSKGKEG